ncbi:MAG: beta strand repeat-containing protein [Alcanivorax sp.]
MNNYYFYYTKEYNYSSKEDISAIREFADKFGVEVEFLQNGHIQFYGKKESVEHIKDILIGKLSLDDGSLDSVIGAQYQDEEENQQYIDTADADTKVNIDQPIQEHEQDLSFVEEIIEGFADSQNSGDTANSENSNESATSPAQDQNQNTVTNAQRNQSNAEVDPEFRLIDRPTVEWDDAMQGDVVSSDGAIEDVLVQEHSHGQTVTDKANSEQINPVEDTLPPNVDPLVFDDAFAHVENAAAAELWDDILSNDLDNEELSIASVDTSSTNGTVVLNVGGNSLLYSTGTAFDYLATGQTATDTFTYTVDDGRGAEGSATVTMTITGINDNPTAVADAISVNEGAINGTLHATLLSNDDDVDTSDVIDITSVDDTGLTGVLAFDAGADTLSYTAKGFESLAVGETTTDTFTYTISDGNGGTDTQTVTMTIVGQNDDPRAVADSAFLDAGETDATLYADLLSNDTDIDTSDVIDITSVDDTDTTGTLVFDAGADTLTYTATGFESLAAGETTTDTFTYTISDGNGGTDTTTVTLTITGVNDAPTAVADAISINEGATDGTLHATLLSNDTDVDASDVLDITLLDTTSLTGTLVFDAGGNTLTYTATGFESLAAGETATDSFAYSITDGNGGRDTATVTLTIVGQNDGPVALDDAAATDEDTTTSGNVLADNGSGADYDIDTSDTLLLQTDGMGLDGSNGGTFVFDTKGNFTFDPGSEFQDLDDGETRTTSVTYTISDGNGGTDTATLAVTVSGLNDAPVATNDSNQGELDEGGNTIIINESDLLSNDTDPENDTLSIVGMSIDPSEGTITDNGDGTWTYTSTVDSLSYAGQPIITYTIEDDSGLQDTGTFNIRVFNVVTGTPGDDVLTSAATNTPHKFIGLDGNDDITGSDQRDIFIVANGNNIMAGENGNDDFIFEGALTGENTVDGGAGTDRIFGSDGDDSFTLAGISSINTINMGDGNDTIYGTTGDDTYNFAAVGFTGLETFDGNGGTDIIIGNSSNNTINLRNITTMIGIDHIDGQGGDDQIYGSQSDDHIYASAGIDFLRGEGGDDTFYVFGTANFSNPDGYIGGSGYDKIVGTAADDDIAIDGTGYRGFRGIEEIDGGAGFNRILGDDYGSQRNDNLDFSDVLLFNIDYIDGRSGNDTIHGSQAADTIKISAGSDTLYGEGGDDTFEFAGSKQEADTIYGGGGTDTIMGSAGDDVLGLKALGGVEIIDGGAGTNYFRAHAGSTIDLSSFTNGVDFLNFDYITDGASNETLHATMGDDTIVLQTGTGKDNFYGHEGDDIFTIDGIQDGADIINGGDGTDSLIGGRGDESVRLLQFTEMEHVDLGAGTNLIIIDRDDSADFSSFAAGDFLNVTEIQDDIGSENITGSQGNDTIRITADASTDILDGDLGDDTFVISGTQTGRDQIIGGTGNDRLIGSSGDDHMTFEVLSSIESIDLGDGTNTLQAASGITIDFSSYDATTFLNVSLITDSTGAVETITGSQTDDTFSIQSDGYNDIFNGGEGNDTFVINGNNTASDFISGGNGNDAIIGTSGDDSFRFVNVSSIESIDLGAGDNTLYGAANATLDLSGYALRSVLNVTITDTTGTETVYGTQGDDVIASTADGNDDALYGEAGADTFLFNAIGAQSDTIEDFTTDEGDSIDISNILSAYDPMEDAIADFVTITGGGSEMTLSIDVDGADNGANFVDVVVFDNTNQTLEDMINSGSIMI